MNISCKADKLTIYPSGQTNGAHISETLSTMNYQTKAANYCSLLEIERYKSLKKHNGVSILILITVTVALAPGKPLCHVSLEDFSSYHSEEESSF